MLRASLVLKRALVYECLEQVCMKKLFDDIRASVCFFSCGTQKTISTLRGVLLYGPMCCMHGTLLYYTNSHA